MKTEQINSIFGIILKGITIICIVVVTFVYWNKRNIGTYQNMNSETGLKILNTQTGEIAFLRDNGQQYVRFMLYSFTQGKIIASKPEYFDKPTK